MRKPGKDASMRRIGKDSTLYLQQFDMPDGGYTALICAIVNQAIIDYNTCPIKSKTYRSAKSFLKEWNMLKKGDRR